MNMYRSFDDAQCECNIKQWKIINVYAIIQIVFDHGKIRVSTSEKCLNLVHPNLQYIKENIYHN